MSKFYSNEQIIVDAEELALAIENHEFELHYQPKVNVHHGKVNEVEALIRWQHPQKGMIPPNEFIPLAEKMNLIIPLGNWVIETACLQIKKFQAEHGIRLTVAVNISPLQLYNSDFHNIVQGIIERTNISSQQLKFEITESIMLDQAEILPMINRIKKLGIRFSLDDFGTGYSSLTLLKEFPIDEIKIDRSFIKNSVFDYKNKTIVRAMIAMAQQLSIDITAEGVETEEQLLFLHEEYYAQIQGFYFSKPVPLQTLKSKIQHIEKMLSEIEGNYHLVEKYQCEKELDEARKDLEETMRKQQGMILKYKKVGDQFVHTLSDGELLYDMGFTPSDLIGHTLYDLLPHNEAARKESFYEQAWQGEDVTYEAYLNGYYYLAKLRPVRLNGKVHEVILSAVDITDRIEVEERFQKIAAHTFSGVSIFIENKIVYANKAAGDILKVDDLIGKGIQEVLNFDENLFLTQLQEVAKGEKIQIFDLTTTLVEGTQLDLKVGIVPVKFDNKVASMLLFTDETKLRDVERIMKKSDKALADVNHALNESSIVAITDQKGTIQFVNDKFCQISGFDADEVIGENHRILNSKYHPRSFFQEMWRTIARGEAWHGEIRNKTKDGSIYWVDTTIVPFLNEKGKPYQYISIRNDITERKLTEEKLRKSQEKLKYLAFHDPLTSISNRRMFLQELDRLIKESAKDDLKFAVAFMDMDGLKKINDAIGHEGGDRAIQKFVNMVSEVVRDRALISRHGGDEFTLLIPNLKDEQEAIQLIEELLEKLKQSYHLLFPIRASVGLAFYPKDATSRNKILKLADSALYSAKKKGKNQYRLAEPKE